MYNFIASFNLMGGFISFFEPSGLLNKYLVITIHSAFVAYGLVFIGFYLVRNKKQRQIIKFQAAVVVYFILCLIALLLTLHFMI